jgi:antitoxin HicB
VFLSQGQTLEEAYEMIQDAKKGWLDFALQNGDTIPEPTREEYSGKFNIRIPKFLHRVLVLKARSR